MRALAARLWHSPTFTTWGSVAVRLASVTLVLPLVLVRFEAPDIAVWQLFSVLFMLGMMLDFGLAPTFSRLLAYARVGASLGAMGRPDSCVRQPMPGSVAGQVAVFGALRWLYTRLALVAAVTLASGGTLALRHSIEQTTDPTRAWGAWALVAATTAIGFWGNGYGAALQGMDRIAVLRRWEIVCGMAQVGSAVLVMLLGGDLLALTASYQVWIIFNSIRNRMLIKHQFPALMRAPAKIDREVLRVLWPASWRSGVGVLLSQGLVQGSGIAYSQVAPVEDVAAYLLALRVITTINQFAAASFYSKLPRLAELQVSGARVAQLALAQRGMRVAHWTFIAGAGIVAVAAAPLLAEIGSKTRFVPPLIWSLMCSAFFIERFGAMHLQLYSVTNHIVWHIANGVTGLAMTVISIVLYPFLGLTALLLAMLMSYGGFYAIYSFRKSSSYFQFSPVLFERSVSLPPAVALIVICVANVIGAGSS